MLFSLDKCQTSLLKESVFKEFNQYKKKLRYSHATIDVDKNK